MSVNWDAAEEIDIPKGSFIGWGMTKGQHVTGKVLEYSDTGGKDTKDNICPQVTVELTEPAASFNKIGTRTDYGIGDLVSVTGSQVQLKRGLKVAAPSPGDLVKITLTDVKVLPNTNTLKEFSIKVARGAGSPVPTPVGAVSGGFAEEPPF
ncbi:type 1 glutamine amidotransferase family protein [Mycobacteroides abscessus]|uniref:hypothetical protein n=1 Tax=Mycobacteroides abscessus TaxID=36809 RepID=UPI000C269132|nr:hypothetical protein [Mycobacteroides abscessus]